MAFNECAIGRTYLALGSEEGARVFTASDTILESGTSILSGDLYLSSAGNSSSATLYNDNNSTSDFSLDVGDSMVYKFTVSESTGFVASAKVQFGDIEAGFEASSGGRIFAKTDGASRQYGTTLYGNGQVLSITVTITKQAGDNSAIQIDITGNEGSDTVSISGAMGTGRTVVFTKELYISYMRVNQAYVVGNDLESTCVGVKYATVTPRKPLMGYTTQISMQWKTNVIANNTIKVFDYGSQYDQYTCSYEYVRKVTEAEELATLAESTYRGQSVNIDTVTGESNPSFLPFAPHVSNSNPLIYITNYGVSQSNPLGTTHRFGMEIVPNETLTFNSQDTICAGGGFRFGGLADTELPKMEYLSEYKVNNNRYGASSNLNWSPETAQHRYCRLIWEGSKQNAINVLVEALVNQRSLAFTMNAGSNHYPFGIDAGQGDFTVRISNPMIEVVAISADTYRVSLEVVRVV